MLECAVHALEQGCPNLKKAKFDHVEAPASQHSLRTLREVSINLSISLGVLRGNINLQRFSCLCCSQPKETQRESKKPSSEP